MKKILTIIGIIALFLLVGCDLQEGPITGKAVQETANTKVSTRLSWFINSLHSGYFVADELGFYEKAGLEVTNNPGGPDFPAINLVISGADDFGLISGIDPLLIAKSKGVPIKAIAVLHQKDPNVFLSLKGSGITKPTDFAGKKVGIFYGHPLESYYRGMMKKYDVKNVEEVPMKFDVSPLLSGQVDVMGGFVVNHLLLIQEQGYDANVIEPSDYGIKSYGFTVFTTEEMIKKNPQLVKKYLDTTLRGYEWTLKNPKKATDIVVKYNPALKDQYDHQFNQLKLNIEHFKPKSTSKIGCMNEQVWKESYERLVEQGLIENEFDYRETFTTEFLTGVC